MDKVSLKKLTVVQLRDKCKEMGIKGYSKMNKEEIIDLILKTIQQSTQETSVSVARVSPGVSHRASPPRTTAPTTTVPSVSVARVSPRARSRSPSPKPTSTRAPLPRRPSPPNMGMFSVMPNDMMRLITSKMNPGTYQQFRSASKAMRQQLVSQSTKDQKEYIKIKDKMRKNTGIIPYKLAVKLNIPLSENEKRDKKLVIVPRLILEKFDEFTGYTDEYQGDLMKMYQALGDHFEINDKDIKLTPMIDFYTDLINRKSDEMSLLTRKLGTIEIETKGKIKGKK